MYCVPASLSPVGCRGRRTEVEAGRNDRGDVTTEVEGGEKDLWGVRIGGLRWKLAEMTGGVEGLSGG